LARRKPEAAAPAPAPAAAPAAAAGHGTHQPLQWGLLEGLLGFHVARATVHTQAAFQTHLGGPLGLKPVEFSLLALLQANGPLTAKRLAPALAMSAPAFSLLADRLQERGWVQSERASSDRRSRHLALTAAGRALIERAAPACAVMEGGLRAGLSPAEWAMLLELLRKAGRPQR
jgi:DNA-binding MarR family transcriptional regulator